MPDVSVDAQGQLGGPANARQKRFAKRKRWCATLVRDGRPALEGDRLVGNARVFSRRRRVVMGGRSD